VNKIEKLKCSKRRSKMKRTKKETKELVLKWAYEYAKSGRFRDNAMIEIRLRADGYPEARALLDDYFIRNELNEICKQNYKKETKEI
jgi:hypothetical protein